MTELHYLTATEMVRLLRAREISAVELMRAHLARIEQVNPAVNAIVTLVAERALEAAARRRRERAEGPPARRARRAQGPGRHRGRQDHVRLAAVRGPRP
ncbi:hypothetical protein [Nonomuraea dietziae]|uniref:hypothetical protein n=1 Tax=Nonomuraea dietziae TaxID=65515 RepID=UPI0031DED54A